MKLFQNEVSPQSETASCKFFVNCAFALNG